MRQKIGSTLWHHRPTPLSRHFPQPFPSLQTVLTNATAVSSYRAFTNNSPSSTSIPTPQRTCRVYNITGGVVPYDQAWLWQQRLLHERIAWQRETPTPPVGHDVLLLLEHPSVYTLGRGSSLDHLRFDPSDPACRHEVRRTERGGEVTWHGPGQIVGYPVMDLNYHKKDLHWYLRQLEEVLIRVLALHGLEGERETEHTGVWVGGAKIAAIGLNASRWITSHGFALNVNPEMQPFESIVPCGIQGRPVTRLFDLVPPEGIAVGGGGGGGSGGGATASAADAGGGGSVGVGGAIGSVRSHAIREFGDIFGLKMEIEEVDAEAGAGGGLEGKLFPSACDPALLARLRAESRRQLELTTRRRV